MSGGIMGGGIMSDRSNELAESQAARGIEEARTRAGGIYMIPEGRDLVFTIDCATPVATESSDLSL